MWGGFQRFSECGVVRRRRTVTWGNERRWLEQQVRAHDERQRHSSSGGDDERVPVPNRRCCLLNGFARRCQDLSSFLIIRA
jgi:hypothetical protein